MKIKKPREKTNTVSILLIITLSCIGLTGVLFTNIKNVKAANMSCSTINNYITNNWETQENNTMLWFVRDWISSYYGDGYEWRDFECPIYIGSEYNKAVLNYVYADDCFELRINGQPIWGVAPYYKQCGWHRSDSFGYYDISNKINFGSTNTIYMKNYNDGGGHREMGAGIILYKSPPAQMTTTTATGKCSGDSPYVNLTWGATSNPAQFKIMRWISNGGPGWESYNTWFVSGSSRELNDFDNYSSKTGRRVLYQIYTANEYGYVDSLGPQVDAYIPNCFSPPTINWINANFRCDNGVVKADVSWSASNYDNILVNRQKRTFKPFNEGNRYSGIGNSFIDTGLLENTLYSYTIYAWKGDKAASAATGFKLSPTCPVVVVPVTFKVLMVGKEIQINRDNLIINYDSNAVNNPPPGFKELLTPIWEETNP